MLFTKILGCLMPIILGILAKIAEKVIQDKKQEEEVEKEREYDYISIGVIIVCEIYSIVNIFVDEAIFSTLLWIQDYWEIAGIYILSVAILPSVIAKKERRKGTFTAQESYADQNRKLNLRGAAASCAVLGLVYSIVGDFRYLKAFYIEDLVPVIASVSLWMVIIYQKIESKKYKAHKVDHDTSLKHMNQKLNLLHLFNVYFLAIISVVYLVAYTIYCRNNHIDIVIQPVAYYILITVALWYFYTLMQHKYRYLYILSIILIPVILIASMYWMTWFALSQKMRLWQWIFAFAHTMFFMFSIYRREKVICVRRYNGEGDCKGKKFGKWEFKCENYFLLILPIIIGVIYFLAWVLPMFIDRLPANEAYHYIDLICEGTDVDADAMIEMAEEQEMYNEINGNYDIVAFMRFLSEELGEQLLEKGIIEEEGGMPTRDVLEERLKNAPRERNKDK